MIEQRGPIRIVTVNRPEARNAVNRAAWEELDQALTLAERDPACRGLILTASGPDFISGGDLKEAQSLVTAEQVRSWSDRAKAILNRIGRLPFPVIAAIEGHAVGGGCEIALACDMRIASESARFSFWEVRNAVTTGWGGGRRLQALVGRAAALEFLLTGDTIDSARALAAGLVNRVVPAGQALAAATALAEQIAAQPPLAVAAMKGLLYSAEGKTEAEADRLETDQFISTWLSADHAEAIRSFLERRPPKWAGR